MARAVNQIFLIGRLTRDVELRTTPTGKQVANFSLAVDKKSGEGADFVNCIAWEKTADLLQQYTGKGSKVHVQGSLQSREWETKEGQKRKDWEVVVTDVTFLDPKTESQQSVQEQDKSDDNIDFKQYSILEMNDVELYVDGNKV